MRDGRFVLIPVMALILAPVSLRAQKVDEPLPPEVKHQVILLKHVSAVDTAKAIKEVMRGNPVRVIADERTNSVIILAQDNELSLIKELVTKLDAPAAPIDGDDASVQVFALRHVPVENIVNALKTVIGNTKARIATDPGSNAIIVSGDKNAKMLIGALLEKLDRPAARDADGREMRVRVVWLAGQTRDAERPDSSKPPDDLKEVITELAKIGVRNPILISQAVVNAAANGKFSVQGSAELGGTPCSLLISGIVSDHAGAAPSLKIQIEALGTAQSALGGKGLPKASPICRIETTISAPPGHPVVLGVTPTENMTSVFVVQLVPRKEIAKP